MVVKFNVKKLVISLLVPIITGSIAALITNKDMSIYKNINTPPFSPPMIVFPIVWSVLYILMGVSLYMIWTAQNSSLDKSGAYIAFAVQLFLNFIWTPIFFSAKQYLIAAIVLVMMIIAVVIMIFKFKKIRPNAAYLQIPYLIWLLCAMYLNIGVYILNK